MTPNPAFERSARQRRCRVPSSLRSSAPAQRERLDVMNAILLTAALALATPMAFAASGDLRCGSSTASSYVSTSKLSPYFVFIVRGQGFASYLPLSQENEHLSIRCERARGGKLLFLILHACGGSGCADQSSFGVVDATNGRLLLAASQRHKGNADEAARMVGRDIEPFSCTPLRRGRVIRQGRERCVTSPLSLD
jgi:hypothetical protein